jgi:hypothetical protein
LQEKLRQKAMEDLDIDLIFEPRGSAAVLQKASMNPQSFDLYEQWSNSIRPLWASGSIQPIDKKRLQYKFEMVHNEKKYLASTIEFLSLYVDLKERKVTEFEDEKIKIMNDFILKNEINFNDEDLKFSNKLKK